ncbi:MAG: hypothetical protein CMH83_13515 [Nocardioides sp.]|nr:hypothetical protein [Nocardioides sp.]
MVSRTSRQGTAAHRRAQAAFRAVGVILATAMVMVGLQAAAPRNAAATTTPAIWVGSPIRGTWGVPGDTSTTPGCCPAHHMLFKASPRNDWSVDLSSIPSGDDRVLLYAAPSDGRLASRVSARVLQLIDDNACRYGGGGDLVTVGIYFDNVLRGRVTFAHVARNPALRVNGTISRWGGWIGNVDRGIRRDPACWTGPHVHFEMRAEREYSCWNKGLRTGNGLSRSNFLGFITGPTTARSSQRCP